MESNRRPATSRSKGGSISANPFLDPIVAPPYTQKLSQHPRSAPTNPPQTMLEAVRDVVTIRPVDSPRSKVSRSQTGVSQSSTTPPRSRRSQSQDSVVPATKEVEKPKVARAATKGAKKGSTHVDVIDRLDFTGVGAAMFHHDGPFDACAPSRNRHRTKAPMLAWTPADESGPTLAAAAAATKSTAHRHLEPIPAAEIAALAGPPVPPKSSKAKDSMDDYFANMPESPKTAKKRHDALAEAWGRHEPEPYEEFFAASPVTNGGRANGETGLASAASSIHGGRESRRNRDDRPTRRATNRPPPPPPQPISLPGAWSDDTTLAGDMSSSLPGSSPPLVPPGPKRSRSLMHRIRKMRDNPNVPVSYDDDEPELPPPVDVSPSSSDHNHSSAGSSVPVPPATRPTHKHQSSILGRFGKSTSMDENAVEGKAGPPSPKDQAFDSAALGRKTSIMQKVKGVVGRAK